MSCQEHTSGAVMDSGATGRFSIEFTDDLLDALADRLAPRVAALVRQQEDGDGWLDSAAAADYLALSKNALHKLSSSKAIPLEQESPGCKLWFRRSDLDAWRRGERRVDG